MQLYYRFRGVAWFHWSKNGTYSCWPKVLSESNARTGVGLGWVGWVVELGFELELSQAKCYIGDCCWIVEFWVVCWYWYYDSLVVIPVGQKEKANINNIVTKFGLEKFRCILNQSESTRMHNMCARGYYSDSWISIVFAQFLKCCTRDRHDPNRPRCELSLKGYRYVFSLW